MHVTSFIFISSSGTLKLLYLTHSMVNTNAMCNMNYCSFAISISHTNTSAAIRSLLSNGFATHELQFAMRCKQFIEYCAMHRLAAASFVCVTLFNIKLKKRKKNFVPKKKQMKKKKHHRDFDSFVKMMLIFILQLEYKTKCLLLFMIEHIFIKAQ